MLPNVLYKGNQFTFPLLPEFHPILTTKKNHIFKNIIGKKVIIPIFIYFINVICFFFIFLLLATSFSSVNSFLYCLAIFLFGS